MPPSNSGDKAAKKTSSGSKDSRSWVRESSHSTTAIGGEVSRMGANLLNKNTTTKDM